MLTKKLFSIIKWSFIIFLFVTSSQTLSSDSNPYITKESNLISDLEVKLNYKINSPAEILTYEPKFDELNIKEQMVISPIFTPDNALDVYKYWIDRANTSVIVQNQYLTQFNSTDWATDSSPVVRSLVDAHNRGVTVRIQINEDSDSDDITGYFLSLGISVRWMGNLASNSDGDYLANTHNKLMIIDDYVTILSSINFSENAFTNNREAGVVVQSSTVANYFKIIFDSDWNDGENPIPSLTQTNFDIKMNLKKKRLDDVYPSHTNISLTNFTGVYNVTLFSNPDNANDVIFHYLNSAKKSIYVSMYTISRPDFNNTLIDLKKANPSLDIRVLISNRRVSTSENENTFTAAQSLVDNLIPVYNSTTDSNKVNGFYHNKYWIIDGKEVFIYSGNWSPRSVSPSKASYTSGEANRDMGIAIHDSNSIASFFKNVWDQDVAVGSEWEIPIGIKQTSFKTAEVVSGVITLSASVTDLNNFDLSYRFNDQNFIEVVDSNNGFSVSFNTIDLPNGINTFEVKAEFNSQVFTDKVDVNIINFDQNSDNWRVLITEIYPNPDPEPDSESEFIELTNSFPFDVLLEGWKIGDNNDLYTFSTNYKIPTYTSIIIARDTTAFENIFSVTADFELNFALANTQDYVQFLNENGDYIDFVSYGIDAFDNSETLDVPGAGLSLQRSPLHIDRNLASDFTINTPDPKGSVPHTSIISTTSPLALLPIFLALGILIIRRNKNNGKN
ncbi:MAG: Cardiolipin synthase [Candidatus Heimdallarchaeota archaeon LC_3]|nr:MAG: Cardiolipin synthase [Candidatus Heimdallarchaeota archaeon LC_3]